MDPAARLTALLSQLDADRGRLEKLHAYATGTPDLPRIPARAGAEVSTLARISRTDWGGLIVGAVSERLVVDGVTTTDPRLEDLVWGWWQANSLDARQTAIHTDALVCADTFVLVWPAADGGPPTIRGLDRRDTVGRTLGNDPWQLLEAAYRWEAPVVGGGTVDMATLYDAETATMFAKHPDRGGAPVDVPRWWRPVPDTVPVDPGAGWTQVDTVSHSLGACPVVRITNTPNLRGAGASDIEPHIPVIDRITGTLMGRLTAGKFGAYRQRWVSGQPLGVQTDPQTGEPVLGPDGRPLPAGAPYAYGDDLLWVSENPDTKFGSLEATDLRPIVEAVEQDVKHLAAVSRTPAHYLLSGGANPPSAEALLAAETGLVSKVHRRQLDFGEAWEQVLRLAATAAGVPAVADDSGLQVVWRDTSVRSPGAVADALLKMRQVGIPLEVLLEQLGNSPQSVRRIVALADAESRQQAAAQALAFGG